MVHGDVGESARGCFTCRMSVEVGVGAGSEKTSKCQCGKPKRRAKNKYIYKRRDARNGETLRSDLKCAWRQIDPLTRNIFKMISLRRRFKRLRANIERGEERGERGGISTPTAFCERELLTERHVLKLSSGGVFCGGCGTRCGRKSPAS